MVESTDNTLLAFQNGSSARAGPFFQKLKATAHGDALGKIRARQWMKKAHLSGEVPPYLAEKAPLPPY